MPSQAKVLKTDSANGTTVEPVQGKTPAVVSMANAAFAPTASPALALQQRLIESMAATIEAAGDAQDDIARWPGIARIAFIVGASALLWTIGIALATYSM